MAFEDKNLASLTEDDIRTLVATGRREGPTLEYKSELYETGDRGNREFLLDVCMFANASGGTILIGIPEMRDAQERATGAPDDAELGVDCPNPEQVLLGYETRILEAIDERLPVEMAAINLANGRHIFAIRIPNSLAKPHRVRYQKHTYFPSRRERHRYELDAREIKDIAMRTASQSERAEAIVASAINDPINMDPNAPVLIAALVPVFSNNFIVDLKLQAVFDALMTFALPGEGSVIPRYSVDGLQRIGPRNLTLRFAHNGLLKLRAPIASRMVQIDTPIHRGAGTRFYPTAIDLFLRALLVGGANVIEAAGLTPPALLGVSLWTRHPYVAAHDDENLGTVFPGATHKFPILPLTTLGRSADSQVRQLCDLIHQTFGLSGSPLFTMDGKWQGRESWRE